MTIKTATKVLTLQTINQNILNVDYAVRGEIALRAEALKQELADGKKHDFDKVVSCNIGNPQQLNQKPITFFRQVASLTEYTDLLADPKKLEGLFPKDAIERAKTLVKEVQSLGAYSHSQGVPYIRKRVAKFIQERDGYPSNPDNIFLTTGASSGVQLIIQLLAHNPSVGVLIPIPQYPLYTATLALFNAKAVPYFLDEESDWSLNIEQLRENLHKARKEGIDVRALVIINPGNPTGQCLSIDNMHEIIKLCFRERLVLMADEVYQTNIYLPETRPFHSFKKALMSMDKQFYELELISFHSISKGMIGECGRRGGYFELNGIDPKVIAQIYKVASVNLCPNLPGQIMVDLMLHPPQKGDESYELYQQEFKAIFESLRRRAIRLHEAFNSMEGVTCNLAQGAMYLFPRIRLPPKFVEISEAAGKKPDGEYAMEMLNATGVCVVPGSGFQQAEGTYHFRATFLPPEDQVESFIANLQKFHLDFMAKYPS